MFNRSLSVCLAAGLALSVVCVANAGTTLRAIYTAIPGDPTSQVPGKDQRTACLARAADRCRHRRMGLV